MKVLMFGWEFPPHITGGLGTACYGITKGLSQNGVDISFVVPKLYGGEDGGSIRLLNAEDIPMSNLKSETEEYFKKIRYYQVKSGLIPYLSPEDYIEFVNKSFETGTKKIKTEGKKFKFSGKYGADLFEEIYRYAMVASTIAGKKDFDVINAHDWLTIPSGIAAKSVSGKPLVVHIHATEFDRSGENINKKVFEIEKAGMEQADKIITVSNYTKSIVINKYGIDEKKVKAIHNAVEPSEVALKKNIKKNVDEKIVTFLGRITMQKGPEYFVEAANKILQKNENVRFVMAGSGDMQRKMIKRVAQLGISTKFHFTGFLKGDDVHKMFALSDVYVMPSVSEPFGISPLEAMLSGLPVIISKQSGVSEILKNAIKVDFWDIDALADSIYGLLNYKGLSSLLGKYGKEEVNKISWKNNGKKLLETYNSLLNK